MYDWTYKKGDSYGNNVGVLIKDKNFKTGQEVRDALRQGRILILRKKKKFVDESSPKDYLSE